MRDVMLDADDLRERRFPTRRVGCLSCQRRAGSENGAPRQTRSRDNPDAGPRRSLQVAFTVAASPPRRGGRPDWLASFRDRRYAG